MKMGRLQGFLVIIILCLCSSFSSAATPKNDPSLDESIRLNQLLGGHEQLYYLIEFCQVSARLSSPWQQTRDMAVALFRVASTEQDSRLHAVAQKNAATCLSYVDPAAAMELLHKVNFPRPTGDQWWYEDPRYNAAEKIFINFLFPAGVTPQAVSSVISEAKYLGQTGQYPYVAAVQVINRLPVSFKKDIDTLLNDALVSYANETGFYNRDEEFLRLLQLLKSPFVDKALVSRALTTFVQRLKNDPVHIPGDYYAEVHIDANGKVFPFTDRSQAFLFQVFPVIRHFNPTLAAQLRQQDSKLDQAVGSMSYISGGIFQGDPTSEEATRQHLQWLQDSLVNRIKEIRARQDCDQTVAARLAERLKDPTSRIVGLSVAIPGVTQTSPSEAHTMFDTQFSELGKLDDPGKLRAMVALVPAAYHLGDSKQYDSMSAQALDLGVQVFNHASANRAQNHEGFNELEDLATFTAKQPVDVLQAKVQQLPDSWLKAYLLLYEAAGRAKQKAAQPSGPCPY